MALKRDEEKPMMPATELPPGHIQCADDAKCRFPGRLWIEGLMPKERVCVDHYYARIDRRNGLSS